MPDCIKIAIFCLLMVTAPALAEVAEPNDELSNAQAQLAADLPPAAPWANVELGISLGSPGGLNAQVGIWSNELPLLARLSAGYVQIRSGNRSAGFEGVVGYQFLQRSNLRLYSGIALTSFYNEMDQDLSWKGIGPNIGVYLSGFQMSAGISFGEGINQTNQQRFHNPQFLFQIGYSFLL